MATAEGAGAGVVVAGRLAGAGLPVVPGLAGVVAPGFDWLTPWYSSYIFCRRFSEPSPDVVVAAGVAAGAVEAGLVTLPAGLVPVADVGFVVVVVVFLAGVVCANTSEPHKHIITAERQIFFILDRTGVEW